MGQQQNLVNAACQQLNSISSAESYYSKSWKVISMMTLNGDVAKIAAMLRGEQPPAPTPQINTPSPTPLLTPGTPIQAPTPVSPGNYCCSFDYKDCSGSEYCNSSSESCAGCNGLWIVDSPKQCTALWQQSNDASSDCCGPASCTSGGGSYYQCQPGGPAPVPITPAPISPPVSTPTIPPISTPLKEPTPYPTHKAPTPYPTHKAPTPYPTVKAPTPYPIKYCSLKDESCERNTDCCKKNVTRHLKTCKK